MVNPEKIADGHPEARRVLRHVSAIGRRRRLREHASEPYRGAARGDAGRPGRPHPRDPRPRGQAVGLRRGDPARQALRELLPDAGLRVPGPGRGALAGSPRRTAGQVLLQLHARRRRRCSRSSPRVMSAGSSDTWRWPRRSRPPARQSAVQDGRRLAGVLGSVARSIGASRPCIGRRGRLDGHGCARSASTRSSAAAGTRPADRLAASDAKRRGGRDRTAMPADPGSDAPRGLPHRPAMHRALGDDHRRRDRAASSPRFGPPRARFSFMSSSGASIGEIAGRSPASEDRAGRMWSRRGGATEISGQVARRQAFRRDPSEGVRRRRRARRSRATASSSVSRRPRA